MNRTWKHALVLALILPVAAFAQFDPLSEGGDARVVFERALAAESREEWEVLLGLGIQAGGFGAADAQAISQALLVQWLTDRWAAEVGAPDRQALVDAIAAADTQYLYVYDVGSQIYQQDGVGDYLLQDGDGYLDPGGEREAWLDHVETASEAALDTWRSQTQATYLELLASEGIDQTSSIGQAFAASIAQYQAAAERDFHALVVRRERQLSYLRLQDTLSARREGEQQSAAAITNELVGATQLDLAAAAESLAATVPGAHEAAAIQVDPEGWQESFREQFEIGLAAWGEAEDRFIAERLAWETDAQQAYAAAEDGWDQAFIEFGQARQTWFAEMNEILAAAQTSWGDTLASFSADIEAEMASLAAAQAQEQATRAQEAQTYLAAFEQAAGVLQMAEENIAYLTEREAGLQQWESNTVRSIDNWRAQIESLRAPEYQANHDIQTWEAREAQLLIKIGRSGNAGYDYYNDVTEYSSVHLDGVTYTRMNYGQALVRVREELAAARSRKSQAIASAAGQIANLRAAIENAQNEVRDSDLQLVQEELAYWQGNDGTGGIRAQFIQIRDAARADILAFVGRMNDGLVGTSSAEQEQHRLTELIAMLEAEASIAQKVLAYAQDTSSDRATRAETAAALEAANSAMQQAQSAYQNAIAELERLSAEDLATAQTDLAARQAELAGLHTQLSDAKQQLENAMVAYRLQDAGVFDRLLEEIDEATAAFLAAGDAGYQSLMSAYFGPAWEAVLVGAVAAGNAAAAELTAGDITNGIPSLEELTDYQTRLESLDLAIFDPTATSAAEFETYLLTTVGLDPLDPNLDAFVTAYTALVDAAEPTRSAARSELVGLYDRALADTVYQIAVRERALELVHGRYGEDLQLLADDQEPVVLSADATAALEAAIYLSDAQAQLGYRLAMLSAQLAVNDALVSAAGVESDWIAGLQAAADRAAAELASANQAAEAAAAAALSAAEDAAAAQTAADTAQQAWEDAITAGEPAEVINAAEAAYDEAAEAAGIAHQAATEAEGAAATAVSAAAVAQAAADQATGALADAQDDTWPDAELAALLADAFDSTDPAQQLAQERYLSGVRALDTAARSELSAARDLLTAVDTSSRQAIATALAADELTAADAHSAQLAAGEVNLLDSLVTTQRDARDAAAAATEALDSYGRFGYAWLEVRVREQIAAIGSGMATFTAAVDTALTANSAIDAQVFATVYQALIVADAPSSIIDTVGLYARALAAEGHLTALDTAAIEAIDDAELAGAHNWLAAHTAQPAGTVTLANLAGHDLPAGADQPDALSAAIYRQMLDAALAVVGLADDFRTNGDLADYTTRAADMPAEQQALAELRAALLSAESAYRDNLAQRVAVEAERHEFSQNAATYYDSTIVALQDAIEALDVQVADQEAVVTAALAVFTAAAERYQEQGRTVAAAEADYEARRLELRTAEAIDDYARSGSVESAPDPQQTVQRTGDDLAAARSALAVITDLIDTDAAAPERDAAYQGLLNTEAAQLQAAQELTLTAEVLSAEMGELEGSVQSAESAIMRLIAESGNYTSNSDWVTPNLAAINANRLHGRSGEFRNYTGYFADGDTTKYATDLGSWILGIMEQGGSGFMRQMSVGLMYELGMAAKYQEVASTPPNIFNPNWYYLENTPPELRNYDLSPFRDSNGNIDRNLTPHVINTTQAARLIETADVGMRNNYSKSEATRNFYSRARDEYDRVKNTPEYQFFRLLMATGNYNVQLRTAAEFDIQNHVVASLSQDGRDARGNINPKRGAPRHDINRAINSLPHYNGGRERGKFLQDGKLTRDIATWRTDSARLAALSETAPTLATVQAEIVRAGGTINTEVTAAVRHVLDNGTASQRRSIASVVQTATGRIAEALAETDVRLAIRAGELTQLARPQETDYLETLGRFLAGEATEAELTAAADARYRAPAFDAVDSLSARTDAALAVDTRTTTGELAQLQTLISRALTSAAHADAGFRQQLVHGYTMDQEQLQRGIERWGSETTNLVTLATDEWNRSYTRLEGRRLRWRQETEEQYAASGQLWDLRYAQLVASRDAWLEDSTRTGMVAGSQAIAVQWDLEATALIADAESAIIPSFNVATPDLAALVEDATGGAMLNELIERANQLQSRARDTNVVVAAYLPTVNTRAAEASTARSVTQDLFDQVTERAAVLAAIQAREQFDMQLEAIESGIGDANQSVADSLTNQMEGAGYRREGSKWRRRSIIGSSLFGGNEWERHEVAVYRDFTSPGFRGSVDLSDEVLDGLSGRAIFTLVGQATEEITRYQVLIFGRSENEQNAEHADFVQPASIDEFDDVLGQILRDSEDAWRRGAGYNRKDDDGNFENKSTEGIFNHHVGYAPVMKSNDPEKIKEAGYGQMGTIMGQFMINEARMQRGHVAFMTPGYRKPMWDDDKDNDGKKDGLLGAPSVATVVDIAANIAISAILGPGIGNVLLGAALNMIDDAVFAVMDVSNGYAEAGDAFGALGKKALVSAASAGIGAGGSALDGAIGTAGTFAEVATDVAIKGTQMVATNAATAVIHNGFDGDAIWNATFGTDALKGYASGLTTTLVSSGLETGIVGTVGEDLGNARSFSGLVGGLAGAGVEYGLTGSTKLNVLNIADFTGGNLNGGLLELNIGGGGTLFDVGQGGVGVNYHALQQAGAGLDVYRTAGRIREQGFRGEEAIAMRMLTSLGKDETDQLFDDLMNGNASFAELAEAGAKARTDLNADNTKTIGLGEGAYGETPFGLGITLVHEAFRDGVIGDEAEQTAETERAVLGHVDAAEAVMAGYGARAVGAAQRQEVQNIRMLQALGADDIVSQYIDGTYDSSADYWRLTADGSLEYDGSGWLRDEEGLYLNTDGSRTAVPTDQTIGAEHVETGLLNILNGGTSGVAYSEYSDAQVQAAQGLMYLAGMRSTEGDPRDVLWNVGGLNEANMGRTIYADALVADHGATIAAPVFMNAFDDETNTVLFGDDVQTIANTLIGIPESSQERFDNYIAAKAGFYGNTNQIAHDLTGLVITQPFQGATGYADNQHRGVDIGVIGNEPGTELLAMYGGMVTRNYESTSAGHSAVIEYGFEFEDFFYTTGIQAQYMHLDARSPLAVGTMVEPDTIVGDMGNTGYVIPAPTPENPNGGTHLHYQLMGNTPGYGANHSIWDIYNDRRDIFLNQVGAPPTSSWASDPTNALNSYSETYFNFYYNTNNMFSYLPAGY